MRGDSSSFSASRPSVSQADGLHLLDASMFWGNAGGVRRVLATKHERLAQHGWRHTILAPGARGAGHVDCGGVALPFSGGYRMLLRQGHAVRLIERARPDIVEAADPYALAWATIAATSRLDVPAVAFCHSNLPALAARLAGRWKGAWAAGKAQAYLTRLYEHFDLVMAPCLGLTAALQSWGVRHAVHQPLGVDCKLFNPGAAEPAWRHSLCLRLGLHPRTRLLVYSGRFAPEKNLPLLAEAMRRLGRGHALLAIGSGLCAPRGSNIFVLPAERDSGRLAMMLASCDAYVHAGDQETFGLGVLEAMACGTPVVTTTAGGLGELADGVATRVDGQRSCDWAEAMHAAVRDEERDAYRLAERALDRARQHDWALIMKQLSARYSRLVGRHMQAAAPVPAMRIQPRLGAAVQRM